MKNGLPCGIELLAPQARPDIGDLAGNFFAASRAFFELYGRLKISKRFREAFQAQENEADRLSELRLLRGQE